MRHHYKGESTTTWQTTLSRNKENIAQTLNAYICPTPYPYHFKSDSLKERPTQKTRANLVKTYRKYNN